MSGGEGEKMDRTRVSEGRRMKLNGGLSRIRGQWGLFVSSSSDRTPQGSPGLLLRAECTTKTIPVSPSATREDTDDPNPISQTK